MPRAARSRSRLALVGATLALAAPVGLTAAPAADASNYPKQVDRSFTKSCVKSARKNGASKSQAKKACGRALKCFEDNLTLKQFIRLDQAIAKGDKTPPYNKVYKRCQKAAAAAVS